MLREHLAEALAGLAVVLVAAGFLLFAWNRSDQGPRGGTYELVARFPNATGVAAGTDVRVSGLKVGRVARQELDPQTYEAVVTLAVDRRVRLPADSSAAITSDGLLGGSFIALLPGGDEDMLAAGDEIFDTQGATDLMSLVGSVINRTGGGGGGSGGSGGESEPGQ